MVKAWGAHLDSLPLLELLNPRKALRFQESALRHIKHVTCPVPLSVLKAVEVEAGAALPRDVRIHFVDGKDQSLEGEDL
jgi:hypothetical protein